MIEFTKDEGKELEIKANLNGVKVTVTGTTSSDDPAVQARLRNAALQLANSIEIAGKNKNEEEE